MKILKTLFVHITLLGLVLCLPLISLSQKLSFANGGGATESRRPSFIVDIVATASTPSGKITSPITFNVTFVKGDQAISLSDTLFTINPTQTHIAYYDLVVSINDWAAATRDTVILELSNIQGATPGNSIRYSFILLPSSSTTLAEATSLNSSMSVYPNPAKDKIVFESTSIVKQVLVTNSIGKGFISIDGSGKELSVDLQLLPSGIYFAYVLTEQGLTKHKFLKL